ncbi:hypothetical protein INS49_000659 [Diaporthe citri]|uniref:uncharacterized protein n=1 Tax=Diaporthe citri TaxID=83186 RepID=UPI001C80A1C8|nr:uncharacterized protein INS49_000659 [Diaporthe citri]KAG6366482.1 hypothetical protein INS49_000659 [Diaporthe citri]
MSKRSVFTTISPLPAGIPRHVVLEFLHNHLEMIDLNPLVKERHPIKPPADAPADEMNCIWYSLTDRITYLPGGLASGDISYTCAFHDLPDGIQTHCRAPLNVDIRDKWTLCGTLPGEPSEPVELGIGAPATGLYIREDVDLRCNLLMTGFVKKNLKKSHATLVDHLVEKARLVMSGDRDSVYTGRSPSSAAEEKPVLFSPSQSSQKQAQRYSGQATTAGTRRSPPPQLGSPFVPGYQPGRPPSMRYPSPHTGEQRPIAPAVAPAVAHQRSHSQHANPPSQFDQHRPAAWPPSAAHALPPTRPQHPEHYSLPPPAHHDNALYPQPLRVRNLSVGSAHVTQPLPGTTMTTSNGGGGRSASYRSSDSSAGSTLTAATSRPSVSEPRTSSSGDDHPEYPSLNPYSDAGGDCGSPSLDEPLPPRKPLLFAELAGSEGLRKGKGEEQARRGAHHPSVLRPGGRAGMGARLDSPFIAELE